MKILGFIGFEYQKLNETKKVIKSLNKAGIKTWMITKDDEDSSILTAKSAGFFEKYSKVVVLSEQTNEDSCINILQDFLNIFISEKEDFKDLIDHRKSQGIYHSLTKKLTSIKKIYKNQKKSSFSEKPSFQSISLKNLKKIKSFTSSKNMKISKNSNSYLVIDKTSFSTINSSPKALKFFVYSLFLAKSVCFSGFSPELNRRVVQIMRENFSFNPSVLVLGSLAGHSAMLGKASVSVAVISEKSRNFYFRADVLIPSFNHLEELILNQGQSFYLKISKIFHLFLLKEVIFIVILFLYQFSSAFSATFFTDFELFVTFELLVTFFPVMIFAVLKKNEGCIKEKSLFYAKNLENCFSRKNLVFYGVFGIFEGVLIFGFIQFGLGNLADSDGMTEDLEVRGTLFFIVMSLSFLFKILVMMQKLNTFTLFSHFFTLLLIGFCVFLTFFGKLSSYSNSLCIFSNQSVFWILATTLPLCLIAFYMFFSAFYFTIIEMKFKSKIEMFKNCLEKVFHKHKKLKKDKNVDGLEICRKTLSFNSEYQEMKYKNHLSKIHHQKLKVMIWLVSIFILVFLCFLYAGVVELKFKLFAVFPAFMSCSFAFITLKKKINGEKVNFLFFLFILAILIVFTIVNGSYFTIRFTVVQVLFSISLSFRWKTAIFQIFSCFILSFLVSLYVLLKKSQNVTLIEFLNVTALNTGISFLCIFITYSIDLTKRSEYSSVQKTKKQFKKSDQILALLLPQFVKKRVNDGVRYIAEDKGVVSVIFCDICEFDQIIQDYSQTELVSLLDDLFSRFDKICQDVGVSKIETVGKTYLACSGLKDFDSDLSSSINEVSHARRAIEMAFAVLHESKKTILKSGNHLKMKIGIHSGPVVAGVVGYHKPQFSLVGDTVNTASRMASTLETYDNIQISQNTLKLLQNDTEGLHFEPRNPEVKGKGNMKTFLVRATHKSSGNLQVIAELSQTINNTSPNIIKQTYIPYQNIQDDTSYHDFIKSSSWRQKISRIFCIESTAEKDFQSNNHKNDLKLRKFGLITSMMITAHLIISSSIEYKIYFDDQALYQMTYFIIDVCFSLLFFIIIHKIHNIRIINYILNMFYWAEMVLFIGFQFAFPRYNQTGLLLFYFRFLLFNFCSGLLFIQCVILNFFLISVLIIQLFFFSPSIENYLYSLFFVVCTLYSNFVRERNLRKDFIIRFLLELENKKTDKLLTYMLPYKILNNLKDEKTLFDQLESVTFIYADIVGFTQWSSQRTPDQVIGMLSEMFTKFDKMCVEFGLYKVYTIGDCYVAMSYSNDHQSRFPEQEAVQVARFAFSLLDLIQEVNLKIGASLNMRIGIHTGNAVGGINGTNVVRYDVYGKDVMIANKMESHGVPGKITVSERTKELVEGISMQEFSFEEFKNVKAWDRTVKMFNMNRK